MFEPPYRSKNFYPGTIILWFGPIAAVPTGWHLCNGKMNTPDLRNRIPVCAGDAYAVGDKTDPAAHTHTYVAGAEIASGANYRNSPYAITLSPPYLSLCYIMKMN